MNSIFKYKIWQLANYDSFLMQYCPTIQNKILGIGVFFLFQLLIVFTSVLTSFSVFFSNDIAVGFLVGVLVTFIFYKWMNFVNKIHHTSQKVGTLVTQIFINFVFSMILSIPFWLFLFEHQILYQLYLRTGKLSFGQTEQLWLKPMGLYESWFLEREGIIILSICIALFMVIAFVYIIPYFLIFNDRKSNYTSVKLNYEKYFK